MRSRESISRRSVTTAGYPKFRMEITRASPNSTPICSRLFTIAKIIMYTPQHLGKMEKVPTSKYTHLHSGFTTEIERGNVSYRSKLEKIKLGRSRYSINRDVLRLSPRTHRPKQSLTTFTPANATNSWSSPATPRSAANLWTWRAVSTTTKPALNIQNTETQSAGSKDFQCFKEWPPFRKKEAK